MRPVFWHPPIELSPGEHAIVTHIRQAKLFIFLRRVRHELFADPFQEELATLFRDSPKGQPAVPPAQLALVTVLQVYTGTSDDEAIEALIMDRRWQLVLDCLDCQEPPLSKAALVRFRLALIRQGLDLRLIERTMELATREGGFGAGHEFEPLVGDWSGRGHIQSHMPRSPHGLEHHRPPARVRAGGGRGRGRRGAGGRFKFESSPGSKLGRPS
jgi:hypothetical protein